MFFDTPVYIVFLILVVAVYWRLGWRKQNVFLLVVSYFFYGWWDWRFLILIWISTVVDFFCARVISRSSNPRQRKALLTLSLVVNFTFLGFFKYFNFFVGSAASALDSLGIHNIPLPLLQIILPPGISFYTFQEVAYIVDVYHRKLEPADSLVDYALFITLFPHLIAGPIQRPSHLLPQVQRPRSLNWENFYAGLMLILTGLFRKCVIADNCGVIANAAFGHRFGDTNLATLLLGGYAFAWQIYGDFSGYSDIARGSAQLMGFHFMVNFRQPYLAKSLQEFWRRWHISLSTWLRDYLYIPLGGNRHGKLSTYKNLAITMLLGGLWHGANWTFVVWGAIHGFGLGIERWIRERFHIAEDTENSLKAGWAARIILFHIVCVSWIFFRAASVQEAFHMLSGVTNLAWQPAYGIAFGFIAVYGAMLFTLDLILETTKEEYPLENFRIRWQMATAAVLVTMVTWFSSSDINAFIYFQF